MAELTPEIEELLKQVRSYLANSNDPWEERRELLNRINDLVSGGEMDMFVGTARELGRMGASYFTLMQTFNQLYASQQAGMNFAEMFAKGFMPGAGMTGNPMMTPVAFDFFKQMTDLMNAQGKMFNK